MKRPGQQLCPPGVLKGQELDADPPSAMRRLRPLAAQMGPSSYGEASRGCQEELPTSAHKLALREKMAPLAAKRLRALGPLRCLEVSPPARLILLQQVLKRPTIHTSLNCPQEAWPDRRWQLKHAVASQV